MGKNRRRSSSQDAVFEEKRRARAEERELIENSPFRNIVLKEKTDKVSRNKGKVAPPLSGHRPSKKPSEIVQGYNPDADFADILASWETTGSPYALPDRKRAEEIRRSQTSFADIFAAWENRGSAKKPSGEVKRASEPYRPKQSFGDILDRYEGKPREKASSSSEKKSPERKTPSTPYERKSAEYRGTRSFGEILDSFEEKQKETFVPSDGMRIEQVEKKSFFRKMDEDDERPEGVAWSVFGDNGSVGREEKRVEKQPSAPLADKYVRASAKYEPKRDFGEILSQYSREKKAPVEKEQKVENPPEKPTFFRKMEKDDERPEGVAWSVFGDNRPIERKAPEPE
ncbi:MAG: hypothetical protein IJ831_11535, partial [Spirochaetales bacterium]|nr:hypothetical protein [Spirochaetales bacterium]